MQTPDLEKLKACQHVARLGVQETVRAIQEGWSEQQACHYLETVLKDLGVDNYFHRPFAWFGERTRFDGIRLYPQFQPRKDRFLKPDEVVILDVAPLFQGVSSDIGYSFSLEPREDLQTAKKYLKKLRETIRQNFETKDLASTIWKTIARDIEANGYDVIHRRYPLQVLGHRLYNHPQHPSHFHFMNFGLEAYKSLLMGGVISEVISPYFQKSVEGIWAIEPHIGKSSVGSSFGAKFEEILVVENGQARWLDEEFI